MVWKIIRESAIVAEDSPKFALRNAAGVSGKEKGRIGVRRWWIDLEPSTVFSHT